MIELRDNSLVEAVGAKERSEPAARSAPVFKSYDYALFAVLMVSSTALFIYFIWRWLSYKDYLSSPLFFSLATLILLLKLVEHEARMLMLPVMRKPRPATPRPGIKVAVVTTFVPGEEPLAMLERTLRALTGLDYPHDAWVLDEGDDEQVRSLCARLGARHFSRRTLARYQTDSGRFQRRSKHGNYNAWLSEIGFDGYEIVSAFDPDHVPEARFLKKVLGYFEDPQVAYVQAPAAYYNQSASFIARGAAEETYAYYSCTQMSAYALGHPFVTGCHNTHRMAALREVGGFAPHDADDLLITLFYRNRGWRGVYVPEILARGLAPVDWAGYVAQQLRWSRSIMDVKFRLFPRLAKGFSVKDRLITLLDGLVYVQSSVAVLLSVMLLVIMLLTDVRLGLFTREMAWNLIALSAVSQLCILYRQRYFLDPANEWGMHLRARLLRYAKWPYTLLALFDVLVGRTEPYVLTRKVKNSRRQFVLCLPHMLVAVSILAAGVVGRLRGHVTYGLVYLFAAALVLASLGLILSEGLSFPDPYDQSLAPSPEGAARLDE